MEQLRLNYTGEEQLALDFTTQREHRQRIVRHIMQQVIAESPYKPDMEWELWFKAQEIEEQNGLPEGVTAWDVHQEYLRTFEGEV